MNRGLYKRVLYSHWMVSSAAMALMLFVCASTAWAGGLSVSLDLSNSTLTEGQPIELRVTVRNDSSDPVETPFPSTSFQEGTLPYDLRDGNGQPLAVLTTKYLAGMPLQKETIEPNRTITNTINLNSYVPNPNNRTSLGLPPGEYRLTLRLDDIHQSNELHFTVLPASTSDLTILHGLDDAYALSTDSYDYASRLNALLQDSDQTSPVRATVLARLYDLYRGIIGSSMQGGAPLCEVTQRYTEEYPNSLLALRSLLDLKDYVPRDEYSDVIAYLQGHLDAQSVVGASLSQLSVN